MRTSNRIDDNREELFARLGPERASLVADTSRILYVFPNLLLFDIEALLSIRQLEPIAPDRTEVRAWELAPTTEPAEARALRIKMLVAFVGPGGLATPDDIEAYEAIQRGVQATTTRAGSRRLQRHQPRVHRRACRAAVRRTAAGAV